MPKRKSTGKRQRFRIFQRDRFTCSYCGRTPPTIVLVIDHVIPVSKGGTGDEENLITSCESCNQGKADKLLSDIPRPIEAALAEQIERREQIEEYNRFLMSARRREQKTARELGRYWCDQMRPDEQAGQWIVGTPRLSSIRLFLQRLPVAEIYEAMDIALSKKTPHPSRDESAWKYFCGIVWSKIREREAGTTDGHG